MGKVKQRVIKKYARKSRFHGNQFTLAAANNTILNNSSTANESGPLATAAGSDDAFSTPTTPSTSTLSSSVSASKVKRIEKCSGENNAEEGYRLIDISILREVFKSFTCPSCQAADLELVEQCAMKLGLASYLSVCCLVCGYSRNFYTSAACGVKGGRDVNRRIVYAMRTCGLGYHGLEKFTTFMNMPKPMTKNNFDKITTLCRNAAKTVAEKSMSDADAKEVRDKVNPETDSVVDTGVTVDGAWSRRGFSSHNGLVAVISVNTGKALDVEPMSKSCNSCTTHERLQNIDPAYTV